MVVEICVRDLNVYTIQAVRLRRLALVVKQINDRRFQLPRSVPWTLVDRWVSVV